MVDAAKHTDSTIVIFLMVFIITETFILINLFIAVICDNLQTLQNRNAEHAKKAAEVSFV